jgi:hypothetical protein
MQLGTRWSVGAEPPQSISEPVRTAILMVERDLDGVDTSDWRWTLTWLESRPVVELDDGTTIRIDHAGAVEIVEPD